MYPPRNIVRVARRRDATEEQKPSTQALYLEIFEHLTQQYQPAELLESEAIKDIASALARLKRARELESRVFEVGLRSRINNGGAEGVRPPHEIHGVTISPSLAIHCESFENAAIAPAPPEESTHRKRIDRRGIAGTELIAGGCSSMDS